MVKTEVVDNVAKEAINYPLIAEYWGTIILFKENHAGTVLKSCTYPVGYYSEDWTDIKLLTILPKGVKVVLENS